MHSTLSILVTATCSIGSFAQPSPHQQVMAVKPVIWVHVPHLTHDPAGNLTIDEDGRRYHYDEQNRLIEILDDNDILMARYVHDGATAVEEFDGNGNRTAFHVNGPLYVDERIASFDDTSDKFTYYLLNRNFSVIGTGNSTGTSIEQLDYSATGELAGAATGPRVAHDHDEDGDVDSLDAADFVDCFGSESGPCKSVHDRDTALVADGKIDQADMQGLIGCLKGPGVTGEELDGCRVSASGPTLPPSGTFALHGRPVEVLRDGKVLYFNRARYYDPEHGRWLRRDPKGYVDGGNLYEAFGGNPTANVDPYGTDFLTLIFGLGYDPGEDVEKATWDGFWGFYERAALSAVSNQENISDLSRSQVQHVLAKEIRSIGEGSLLVGASFSPSQRQLLAAVNPDLSNALTTEAQYELAVLGPAQGGLFVVEGVADIPVDLAELAVNIHPTAIALQITDPEFEYISLPRLRFANGVFLETSEGTASASRFLGGQAVFTLATAGVGSAAIGSSNIVSVGVRTGEAGAARSASLTGRQLLFPFAEEARVGGISSARLLEPNATIITNPARLLEYQPTAITNPARLLEYRIHGNALRSPQTAYLYRLETQSGQFLKWGVTQNMGMRYSRAFMEGKVMRLWGSGTRVEMIRIERGLVETQPGPLNFERWAGIRLESQP